MTQEPGRAERDPIGQHQALVEVAIERFVEHVCAGQFQCAQDAAALAFGVARLAESDIQRAKRPW